jgi:excisionase family DNA binding protein
VSTPAVTLAPEAIEALAEALAGAARPRLTYTPEEACARLGVGRSFFDERIKPELRVIRRGKLVLIPRKELERWVEESAARTLE